MPILERLVGFDTSNPPGKEAEAGAYLADLLAGFGFDVDRQDIGGGRANVIATIANGAGPILAFNTHMDVVPAAEGWTCEPFRLTETADGRLVGRGACDAKGSLASMVAAGARLAAGRSSWSGTLVLVFVVDEEVGSAGARAFAARRPAIDYAVVGEPTRNRVAVAHKGSLRPRIRVLGRSAHSSRPKDGINAIFGAVHLISAFEAAADRVAERSHPLCGAASMTVTRIAGGFADNAVPDRCEFLVDRRMVPGEDEAAVKREIETLLRSAKQRHGVEAEIAEWCPTTGGATETSPDSEIALAGRAASAAYGGDAAHVLGLGGACDLVHFNGIGAAGIVLGPGNSHFAHQPDNPFWRTTCMSP